MKKFKNLLLLFALNAFISAVPAHKNNKVKAASNITTNEQVTIPGIHPLDLTSFKFN